MQTTTRSRLTLVCILITILLDMTGLGIIVPVLPELLEQLTGGSVAEAAVIGGYLVFVYALMQFVFSPVLGNLSDRFGRRPVLLASLLGLTFDYLMMSIAPFVWYLFVGRFIEGIAGASGLVGPSLSETARRIYIAGVLTNSPDHLIAFIVNPKSVDPKTAMPITGITPAMFTRKGR
jgi:MFS family permease